MTRHERKMAVDVLVKVGGCGQPTPGKKAYV
jgi:hypothetical protein